MKDIVLIPKRVGNGARIEVALIPAGSGTPEWKILQGAENVPEVKFKDTMIAQPMIAIKTGIQEEDFGTPTAIETTVPVTINLDQNGLIVDDGLELIAGAYKVRKTVKYILVRFVYEYGGKRYFETFDRVKVTGFSRDGSADQTKAGYSVDFKFYVEPVTTVEEMEEGDGE